MANRKPSELKKSKKQMIPGATIYESKNVILVVKDKKAPATKPKK